MNVLFKLEHIPVTFREGQNFQYIIFTNSPVNICAQGHPKPDKLGPVYFVRYTIREQENLWPPSGNGNFGFQGGIFKGYCEENFVNIRDRP